jgi:hypothetical protein
LTTDRGCCAALSRRAPGNSRGGRRLGELVAPAVTCAGGPHTLSPIPPPWDSPRAGADAPLLGAVGESCSISSEKCGRKSFGHTDAPRSPVDTRPLDTVAICWSVDIPARLQDEDTHSARSTAQSFSPIQVFTAAVDTHLTHLGDFRRRSLSGWEGTLYTTPNCRSSVPPNTVGCASRAWPKAPGRGNSVDSVGVPAAATSWPPRSLARARSFRVSPTPAPALESRNQTSAVAIPRQESWAAIAPGPTFPGNERHWCSRASSRPLR